MPKVDFREEVLNVALAELLEQRGLLSVPETIRKSIARKTKDLPDILVGDLLGLRIVIEGRFDNGKNSRESLLKDSKERVENGRCPIFARRWQMWGSSFAVHNRPRSRRTTASAPYWVAGPVPHICPQLANVGFKSTDNDRVPRSCEARAGMNSRIIKTQCINFCARKLHD